MPLSDFDFDKWVESLQVPAELKDKFKEFGKDEGGRKALAESVMMRSDYSRHLNELKTQEDAIKQKQEALADLERTYRESGSKTQGELDRYKAESAALRKQLFDAQEKIRTEYNAYGNADDTIKDLGLDKVPEFKVEQPKQDQPAFDSSKYVSVEEFNNVRNAALIWPAVINQLQMEHAVLFNKPTDPKFNPIDFTKKVMEEQREPQLVYDEMFGAPARRKEIEKAAITAEVRSSLEAEYQAKIDALAVDPTRIQQYDEHDPFMEAIRSNLPEAGKDPAPLVPTGQPGLAGIEQAREVKKALFQGQP